MPYLDLPSESQWEARRRWFEDRNEEHASVAAYLVSEQGSALLGEVQCCFCAGAWVAVIMLAMAAIDAQLRDIEVPGFRGNTKELIEQAQANPLLQGLRVRRNQLVHVASTLPALTVDAQWLQRHELEQEARGAVLLMLETFYMNPVI